MRIEAEKTEEEIKELEEARAEEKKRKEKTKVHYSLREEWARFKEQPGEEKFWYIWEYYKLHIFAIIGALIILGLVIHSAIEATKPTILQGFQVNLKSYADSSDYMREEYLENRGYDPKKYHIYYDDSLVVDNRPESTGLNPQVLMASSTKIVANVQAADLDYMVMDRYSMDEYCKECILADLTEVLPKETFDRLEAEGRLVKSMQVLSYEDEEEKIPKEVKEIYAGISLQPSAFSDHMEVKDDCYFVIIFNTKRLDTTLDFLNYLLEDSPEQAQS